MKERASDVDERFNCRACGACCVGDLDDGYGYADCTADDVKRMSRHARRRLSATVNGGDGERIMTPGVVTEEFGKSCGFLRGTPGRGVSCGIYATRPDVCRTYKPGGRQCLSVRLELGMPLPWRTR